MSYDIRYNIVAITDANWNISATEVQVTGEPTPAFAGSAQFMNITGLLPGTTYYFAMKVADESANLSMLSNVVTVTIPTAG